MMPYASAAAAGNGKDVIGLGGCQFPTEMK
jgi:hypothetical protein